MRHAATLVLVLTIVACRRDDPAAAPPPAAPDAAIAGAEERAKQAIGALKARLVERLTAALPQGAPAAIAVCNVEAPAIADGLRTDGLTVGRATRKPRNPANLAAGWQADALAHFEGLVAAGQPLAGASFVHRLSDGRTAYAEPLVIQPLCVTCHGAELAADVRDVLAAKYPADQATGYAVGDLRGVAWAEVR